jgi:Fe-S-cluster containining protein
MEEKKNDTAAGGIEPTQLTGKSRFTFACHKGLDCFTKCCHGMDIILAPYDILRLKKKLAMTSGEFLSRHTIDTVHEESGLPLVILKMGDGEKRPCPFLTESGCSVYEDRPSICRYYPIGLATLRVEKEEEKKGTKEERFYFLVREDHCLGHGEEKEWSVDEWREDQGASRDDGINHDWQNAFLRRTLPGEQRVDPKRQSLFHLTCYDLDNFRKFVFESAFLENFEVDRSTVEKIRTDDDELLRFALQYMKFFMMIEQTMKPREGAVENWQARQQEILGEAKVD